MCGFDRLEEAVFFFKIDSLKMFRSVLRPTLFSFQNKPVYLTNCDSTIVLRLFEVSFSVIAVQWFKKKKFCHFNCIKNHTFLASQVFIFDYE